MQQEKQPKNTLNKHIAANVGKQSPSIFLLLTNVSQPSPVKLQPNCGLDHVRHGAVLPPVVEKAQEQED